MLIDTLKIRNPGWGNAANSFDEPLGESGEHYEPICQQGVIGIPLDCFSEQIGFPNYIKIDVDGHELKVIQGATKTLKHKELKGILIEIHDKTSVSREICQLIETYGFTLQKKTHSKMFDNTKYQDINNCIFSRL